MRNWSRVGLVLLLCALCTVALAGPAVAESVTVTIGVGDTVLTVTGKTSPDAFVTIRSEGNVIGTTTAAVDGTYSKIFPAQTPGLHELSLSAHTPSDGDTDTVTLNINIAEHATTTVDVFLPPTLVVENATPPFGQPLNLHGQTFPLSTIKVFIDGTDYATANSDAQGDWGAHIDVSGFASGQHKFFVRVIDGFGDQSYPTALRFFASAPQPGTIIPPAPGTQPQAPQPPVITFPTPGMFWDKPQITVTGLTQLNTQVELWDGSRPLGSVWPDANGSWSIAISLGPQEYNLHARACFEGRCSVFSQAVPFTYQQSGLALPLRISVRRLTYTAHRGEPLPIGITIVNGQAPYQITVQWGDRTSETATYSANQISLSHIFTQPGQYNVVVNVQDAQGRQGSLSLSVEVTNIDSLTWLAGVLTAIASLALLLGALRIGRWLLSKKHHAA